MNWHSCCWTPIQLKRSVRLQVTDPQINRPAQARMYHKVTAQCLLAVYEALHITMHNCSQNQPPSADPFASVQVTLRQLAQKPNTRAMPAPTG